MISRKTFAAFLVGTVLMGFASGRALADRALLVIPARYSVVQFGFDVTRLRSADLVVYDTRGEKGALVLHFWDRQRGDWAKVSQDELRLGALFDDMPTRVFLVGSDRDVPPAVLAAATALGGQLVRVPSLRVVDMVNAVNDGLRFSSSEWKWLAKRHGLETVDLNADRRRYGRYGAPGAKAAPPAVPETAAPSVPMPQGTIEELAPAPIAVPTPAPVAEKPDQPALKAPAEEVRQPGPVEKLPEDK
jgi:hypothetical protein